MRLQNVTPEAKVISLYYKTSKTIGFRGVPWETIVSTLSKYIKRTLATIPNFEVKLTKSKEALQKSCQLAQSKVTWKRTLSILFTELMELRNGAGAGAEKSLNQYLQSKTPKNKNTSLSHDSSFLSQYGDSICYSYRFHICYKYVIHIFWFTITSPLSKYTFVSFTEQSLTVLHML